MLDSSDTTHSSGSIPPINLAQVCYHGIEPKSLASILEAGSLLFPGSIDHNGREVVARDEGEHTGEVRSGRTAPDPRDAQDRKVAESSRRLTRSKLLAKRPHSGGHWPGNLDNPSIPKMEVLDA